MKKLKQYKGKIFVGFFLLLVCFLIFFLLFRTLTRVNVVSLETFVKVAEKNQYKVIHIEKNYEQYSYLESAVSAVSTDNWKMDYFLADNEENAKALYEIFQGQVSQLNFDGKQVKTISKKKMARYVQDNEQYYIYLARNKNSILYVFIPDSHKEEAVSFIQQLGFEK